MPTLRTVEATAKAEKISARQLHRWVAEGKLKRWKIEGDRKLYLDLDELRKLRQPRVVPPPKRG